MSDNDYTPLIESEKKNTSFKKYGAALGVTGFTVAAALLLAGRSKAPAQAPVDLIEMPAFTDLAARMPIDDVEEPLASETTQLSSKWGYPVSWVAKYCNGNFDRIAEM
jgi:hypothetical protein